MAGRGKHALRWGVVAWLGLMSQPLWAHAHLVEQVPAEGESVEGSPERFELRFGEPLRITQFEVSGPGGGIELSDTPVGAMGERHEARPAATLVPGEYRVIWRGLAEDGHTMSGDYRFSVQE
ncbi:copper resistance protein CopC [Halomonas sp. MCCC 1A17488]|uniref:copper resistance CopC family protein n=1 Tax=unclassified Halomonas TaxID=2609666 RepID=UPI0018D1F91D|nr:MULTISPECIES: copper resistance protein CopC [unclassified Halomonas]MCE8017680.1 copper resistance protein CopC [Halomonas sp. MCCC 1A17488]MCG3241013.1 copper resistance protein CopC [Halomonas sp. MCCC 1A17488]QPP48879.1 copper resistance protein CopC [Halomonas sp. SS10-MC5]